jgi:putative ABC transport system permease protein
MSANAIYSPSTPSRKSTRQSKHRMLNKLVIENLKYRWVRTLLSALVVGFQIMSILTLIGLSRGLLEESANRAKGTGADIFLKPGTQGTFSFSSGQLAQKFVPFIEKQPNVAQAVGVLMQNVELVTSISGVDIPEFASLNGGFHYEAGGPPKGPDDLLVDEYYARQNHYKVGESVKLLNHQWHVAGIIQGGMLARLVVPLTTLQALTGNGGNDGKISQILVKLKDPSLTKESVKQLSDVSKGQLQAISIADFASQFNINNIPQLKIFINVVTAMTVMVGFLVVFLSMYTAVIERTREIGILKALGAKPLKIIDLLMREAVVLALLGWMIGIGLAFLAKLAIMNTIPASLSVIDVPDWWPKAALIALTGAILGALYPGLRAARQDAIEALSYE